MRARALRRLPVDVEQDETRQRLHQAVVEGQGLLERRPRASPVTLGAGQNPGLRVHDRHPGRCLDESACYGGRAVEVPARHQAAREHELRRQVARLLGGRLLRELNGRRQGVPLQLDLRELHLRGRGTRVQAQHLRKRLRRRVQVAFRHLAAAKKVMGLGVLRVPLHGLLRVPQGLVDAAVGQ